MVSGKTNRAALVQTTEDFASRTSIHGVAYVFDRTSISCGAFVHLDLARQLVGQAGSLQMP